MVAGPVSVNVFTPLEQMRDLFETYSYLGLPVTNDEGTLVGVARAADVQEKADGTDRKRVPQDKRNRGR